MFEITLSLFSSWKDKKADTLLQRRWSCGDHIRTYSVLEVGQIKSFQIPASW